MDLQGATKLCLTQIVRDQEFVCQLDPAFVDQHAVEDDDLPEDSLPGMSGGPALLLRNELVLNVRLCGVLKQGWSLGDGNRLLYFARLHTVARDGTIVC